MHWSLEIRKVAIEQWLKCNKSATEARRKIRNLLHLNVHQLPSARLISYWGRNCWEAKSVVDGNLSSVRKPKTKTCLTDVTVAIINEVVVQKASTATTHLYS